jgi:hypothetical protein
MTGPQRVKDAIKRIAINTLPPSASALELHYERAEQLADDLSNLPTSLVIRACDEWRKNSAFMPSASHIIKLCQVYEKQERELTASANAKAAPHDITAYCDWINALSWVSTSGDPYRLVGEIGKRRLER